MSESVKIGGIGKNPAIDKINSLNAIDIKNYAVNKMEKMLINAKPDETSYGRAVPIDFSRANWEEDK